MTYKYDAIEIAKIIGDITTLATMVNELTDVCVFVDFSGHVSLLRVRVTPSKKEYNDVIVSDELYTSERWNKSEAGLKSLIQIKLGLKKILRDKKVNTKGLSYTIREEYDYHFS